MFGKKKFKVTSSKVDPAGKKTTISISTDDESIVRKLLDSKKEAMDAEFKETKKASGTNKKNPKPTSKSTKKASLKALPSPKASKPLAKQPQKKETKSNKKEASSLKAYIYNVPELNMIGRGELAVFAPNKKGADRLMDQYCKKTGFHCNFNRTSLTRFHLECIKKYGLTVDNFYQKQLESILNRGVKHSNSNLATSKTKGLFTSSELRKKLRSMIPYREELVLGDEVVKKTNKGYGIRNIKDHDDPMTDYSAYVYGFNEKYIIDIARRKGLLKD